MRTLTLSGTVLGLLLLLATGANIGAAADQSIQVVPLTRDGFVFVSFAVNGVVDEEMEQTIQSGLPTTFAYDVTLQESSPWWFDRTSAYARVSTVVRFDNLTRRYQITFIEDGRVEEVRTTDDEATALQWMTTFRARRLSSHRLVSDGEYHVRVKAQTRPRLLGWVWPWNPGAVLGSVSFRFRP
jgi:hypothetical protein